MTKDERDLLIRMEERQIRNTDKLDALHTRLDTQDIRIDNVEGHIGVLKNNWKWLAGTITIIVAVIIPLFATGVLP